MQSDLQQPSCCFNHSMSSQAAQGGDRTGSDEASKRPEEEELPACGEGPVLPCKGRKVLVPLGGGKDSLTVFELLKVSIKSLLVAVQSVCDHAIGLTSPCMQLVMCSNGSRAPAAALQGICACPREDAGVRQSHRKLCML